MSETTRDEQDPNVPWWERGGFTTIAVISVVLGAVCWIFGAFAEVFDARDIARAFMPYPGGVGLLFGILGVFGPWRGTAIAGIVLNVVALGYALFAPVA